MVILKRIDWNGSPTPETSRLKIHWDRSNMKSNYADVFDISVSREEILLLFGVNQSRIVGSRWTVQPSGCLILNPISAKRFATSLNNFIQEFESKFGPIKVKSLPSAGPGQMTSTQKKAPFKEIEQTHEKVDFLFQLIRSLM